MNDFYVVKRTLQSSEVEYLGNVSKRINSFYPEWDDAIAFPNTAMATQFMNYCKLTDATNAYKVTHVVITLTDV